MGNEYSMFEEFKEVVKKVQDGDNESAMIVLERKEWGENKHAIVGNLESQITLFEWGIHMVAEGSNIDFEKVMALIEDKHKNTDHYMKNVYCGEIK